MSVNLIFIMADSHFEKTGMENLLEKIFSLNCFFFPAIKACSGHTFRDAKVKEMGSHALNLLSEGVEVEMIKFRNKISLVNILESLREKVRYTHLKDDRISDKIQSLSKFQRSVLSMEISGSNEREISKFLNQDQGEITMEIEKMKRILGLCMDEKLIHIFNRSLTIVVNDRLP